MPQHSLDRIFRSLVPSSIWIIPIAVLLIIGANLARGTYAEYQRTHEAEFRLLEAHAAYADAQTASAFDNVGRLLAKIAAARMANPSLPSDIVSPQLDQYLRDSHGIDMLLVTDSHGRVAVATNPSAIGQDLSKLEGFTVHLSPARQQSLFISRPIQALFGSTLITLTLPMVDDLGKFVGVVGAAVDFRFFAETLRKIHSDDSESVTVILNRQGDLIYRRLEPEKFFGRNVANSSQVLQNHLRAEVPVTRHIGPSAIDGRTRLFVTRSIAGTDLNLILSRQQDEVLTRWRQDLAIHLLLFLFSAGVVVYLVGLAQRRQHQVQAASAALQTAKESAEVANSAKSHFLAAASHDLRQPLYALTMLVSLLRHRQLDSGSMKLIQSIEASTLALRDLLNTLLDISRLDAGMVIPQTGTVSVSTLFARLESEFRPQIEAKGLRFRIHRTAGSVVADPTLLMLMLRNLLSNAYHYTDAGGILLGCRVRKDKLLVQVWDTGKGIPASEYEKIFGEYYQLGNPERDRHKGLGLGLSIVDRLANLMGDPVGVRSTVDKGSVFEIAVPIAPANSVAARPVESSGMPAVPIEATILVIDDDQMVLNSTGLLLKNLGYRPILAEGIDEALSQISDDPPALVLADFRLRRSQTGIDAIERIREHLGRPIPGILVTGDTQPERLQEARASGFPLLHKPVAPEILNAQIRGLLARASSA